MKCPNDNCTGYLLERVEESPMGNYRCNNCQSKFRILVLKQFQETLGVIKTGRTN